MTERITKKQALRAAAAKLPLLSDKGIQAQLDFAIGDCSRCSESRAYAEAFRMGAETAQRLIVQKINAIGIPKEKRAAQTNLERKPTPDVAGGV